MRLCALVFVYSLFGTSCEGVGANVPTWLESAQDKPILAHSPSWVWESGWGAVHGEPRKHQEQGKATQRRPLLSLKGDVSMDCGKGTGGRSPGRLPGRGREAGVAGSLASGINQSL